MKHHYVLVLLLAGIFIVAVLGFILSFKKSAPGPDVGVKKDTVQTEASVSENPLKDVYKNPFE